MSRQVSTPSVTTVHPMTMDFDDDNPLEADRELIHDAAHQAGTTLSGRPLPRETDDEGRVWVTCTCGLKIPFEPSDVDE